MKPRALLVDDEPTILITLGAILERHGLEVQTASSGQFAIVQLRKSDFDIVITDMSMESESAGYAVIREANQQRPKPATLIVSAFPDLFADWKTRGATAVLQKPTDVPELLSLVDSLLRRQRAQGA